MMPHSHKLSFEDHETKKLRALDRKNYMKMVKDTPESPNRFVAMKWAKGLKNSGLLSLLFMSHFGLST